MGFGALGVQRLWGPLSYGIIDSGIFFPLGLQAPMGFSYGVW